MPVAFTSTSTSEAFGPSSSTSVIVSGLPFSNATAARVFMAAFLPARLGWTGVGGGRCGEEKPPGGELARRLTVSERNSSRQRTHTRPNYGGPALVWVPAPGPCEFPAREKTSSIDGKALHKEA